MESATEVRNPKPVLSPVEASETCAEPGRSIRNDFEPQIITFACHHCAYAAADLAGALRLTYPTSIKVMEMPCSGRMDVLHMLHAFEDGADGVMVAG